MRIIIAGAGELGRLLASTLSNAAHDVTIIDSDADMLEHINDNLDIKVVEGSCISINTLKDAGIKTADALLAVSGDEAANILCCQLASKWGAENRLPFEFAGSFFGRRRSDSRQIRNLEMCLPFRGMRRQDTECPAEPYACGKDPVFKPRCSHGSIPCQPLLPARGNPCERYPDGFRASELGPFCGNRTAETVPDSPRRHDFRSR